MSRALSSTAKRGLSDGASPTTPPPPVPPRCGPCLRMAAAGSQAATTARLSASAAISPARRRLLGMSADPDVGDGDDEERGHHDPGRQIDLALEAPPRAVAAADSPVTAPDRAPEA